MLVSRDEVSFKEHDYMTTTIILTATENITYRVVFLMEKSVLQTAITPK